MAYDYSHVDWYSLRDHQRDASWEDIFQRRSSATASEFCEWVQFRIDVYIPHCKYQVKSNSFAWFLTACAAAIDHRNFFVCINRIKLRNSK